MKSPFELNFAILLAFGLLLNGCARTRTVSYGQLQMASLANHGGTFPDTTYYCGTEKNYDYFYVEYGVPSYAEGRKYRLLCADSPMKSRFERTTDKDLWIKVTLYGPQPRHAENDAEHRMIAKG